MEFLYFLEGLRNPVFDFFFETITHLGEETFFLLIAILFFWCIDKREGYYILLVGLYGTVLNQIAKITFRINRPWVKDPNFTVVGDAKIEATGYSFPSGHTQNIAGTLGSVAAFNRKRLVSIISLSVIALVAFSRMYLGVHTPLDVGVSLAIAALLVIFLRPLFATEEKFVKSFPWLVISAVVLSLGFIIYVLLLSGDSSIDADNYASALKNSCTLMGCLPGLLLVYFVDTRWLKFNTGAAWYAQIIKLAVGLLGVLAIKSGLSAPLTLLFGNELVARVVRYFLLVSFAGVVWPMTFSRFAKLRIAALDAFSDRVRAFFKRSGNSEKKV